MCCRTAKYSIPKKRDLVKLVYRGRDMQERIGDGRLSSVKASCRLPKQDEARPWGVAWGAELPRMRSTYRKSRLWPRRSRKNCAEKNKNLWNDPVTAEENAAGKSHTLSLRQS